MDTFNVELPKEGEDSIFYLAYGSNMMGASFMQYMNMARTSRSALYKPEDFESYGTRVPHDIYFADINEGGGAAFLDVDNVGNDNLARLWRLSYPQFTALALMECRVRRYEELDWAAFLENKHTIINPYYTYGRVTHMGYVDEIPVLTVVSPRTYQEHKQANNLKAPRLSYRNLIESGKNEVVCLEEKLLSATC